MEAGGSAAGLDGVVGRASGAGDDLGPGGEQGAADARADAPGTAGDDGDAAGQIDGDRHLAPPAAGDPLLPSHLTNVWWKGS